MELSIESFLRCPLTHSPLTRLSKDEVRELNYRISDGVLFHLSGTPVKTPMEAALCSENGVFVYPIIEGIYILMENLAIVLNDDIAKMYRTSLVQEKIDMVDFYDQMGWQQSEKDVFEDASRFEDLRPVSNDYIHNCHIRLAKYFASSGDFLLDIASGPVQYPEYETYSAQYTQRICADISFVALQEARKKLGNRSEYLLCDITNIPLIENSMDAFLSMHTVYHVPENEQLSAFTELHRVLKPNRTGVVVYSWGKNALFMRLFTPVSKSIKTARRIYAKIRKRLKIVPVSVQKNKAPDSPSVDKPYFHAHTFSWVQKHLFPLGYSEMACWRSVSVSFLRNYIHPRLLGKQLLKILFLLEDRYKRFFARFGQYPILICRK